MDMAKERYADRLQEGVGAMPTILHPTVQGPPESPGLATAVKEGWALKETRKLYRFNEKQKEYLVSKFNIGQSTGRKLDGERVAKEMRRALGVDGTRLFTVTEFLTAQQITSFFSRETAKTRHQQASAQEDANAAVEETNFCAARDDVLRSLQLQHPIIVDQYDVCSMVRDDSLKKLKVAMLQNLCKQLGLEVPEFLSLLKEAVRGCSCGR